MALAETNICATLQLHPFSHVTTVHGVSKHVPSLAGYSFNTSTNFYNFWHMSSADIQKSAAGITFSTMSLLLTLHYSLCKIDALDQWCLHMLLCIKWYQSVRKDDVQRLTKQPKLTAIIQSCRLTLFGHIMRMDDNADAKRSC